MLARRTPEESIVLRAGAKHPFRFRRKNNPLVIKTHRSITYVKQQQQSEDNKMAGIVEYLDHAMLPLNDATGDHSQSTDLPFTVETEGLREGFFVHKISEGKLRQTFANVKH